MADTEYPDEEWRAIADAPDYAVSNLGRIKRVNADWQGKGAGRILTPTKCSTGGYLKVSLSVGGRRTTQLMHRIVCAVFHGPAPTEQHEAAHGDGNPANNQANNLRWATPLENGRDRILHGRLPDQRGENGPRAILTDDAVRIIRATKRYNGVLADLAKRFGVTENHVMGLRTKSSTKWRHIHTKPAS